MPGNAVTPTPNNRRKRTKRQEYLKNWKEYVHKIKDSDLVKFVNKLNEKLSEGEDGDVSLAINDLDGLLYDTFGVQLLSDGGVNGGDTEELEPIPGCFWDDPSSLFHFFSEWYDSYFKPLWVVAEFPIVVAFFQSVVLPVLLPMAVGFVLGYLGKKYLFEYWPELPRYGLTIYRIPGGSSAPHTDRLLDAKFHFLSSLDNTTLGGLDYGN